ncbi:GntR family transcriptional regulator [Sporosarcina sp. P12(2017)]|uniref:GntR family transcriptional regulator n=1 Tax=Sporosarcina ureae TaxID=1571 RepID=A0ABN4Z0E0_SPOUR|nr:GntR family transcriptional regulator [Sporosarcina ureae]PIC57059.1 GntR family transcriptional regulator [Sporosarcina sp. P10]PIC60222.1 GntR family transcriptional regulator [Sporosarcina sp. P12(2017)]
MRKEKSEVKLDYTSAIPLHIQLKDIIEKQVAEGIFSEQIPSERQFIGEYNISRSTVREAINLLVREGILEKRHGKGTFVSLKPIHDWLGNLSSTTEAIRDIGMKPGAKLITHYKTIPSTYIQERTGFTEAYFIKRVRYADDIPIGIERHYYPIAIGEELIKYNLDNATLYDLVQNELGIQFAEADQTISSGYLLPEDMEYLDVPANTNFMIAVRIIKDQAGSVVEMEEAFYRSDMYSFKMNLSRKFG